MATSVTKSISFTDDLSNVAEVAHKQDEQGKQIEAGDSLTAGRRVKIVLTDGEHTFTCDTSRDNPLTALLKAQGVKSGKRGRKASS